MKLREAMVLHRRAIQDIEQSTGIDQKIMRMVQYFTEEAHLVEEQLAAGIAALEKIEQAAGQALEGR